MLVPLLIWHFEPIVPALASRGDPAAKSSYYTGLLDYLKGHDQPFGRLEIPFTRSHWEARYVAPAMPLARGWERQLDLRYNAILYSKDLNQATYHEWLVENGVRWVALPSEPLDASSEGELKVIRSQPVYLQPVWHDANWQLWAVSGSDGLTTGPATMSKLTRRFVHPALQRSPATRWCASTATRTGRSPARAKSSASPRPACINSTAEGWTSVTSSGTGDVTVVSRLVRGRRQRLELCGWRMSATVLSRPRSPPVADQLPRADSSGRGGAGRCSAWSSTWRSSRRSGRSISTSSCAPVRPCCTATTRTRARTARRSAPMRRSSIR